MEFGLNRIREREERFAAAKAKLEADLEAYNSDDDDFTSVKISIKDYDVLKRAKLLEQANPNLFGGQYKEDL